MHDPTPFMNPRRVGHHGCSKFGMNFCLATVPLKGLEETGSTKTSVRFLVVTGILGWEGQ